jgi:hypothetical protein
LTADDLDPLLREAFRFEAADLAANREGRLSPRQAALLHGGRRGMQLSLAVFATVMLGTVGIAAFFNARLGERLGGPQGGPLSGLGVPAGVALAVIVVGYFVSRPYLAAVRSPRLSAARGRVEIVSDALDDCRVRVGGTDLRLPDADALPAFLPGVDYRVYYLAGPVATVLSVEALSGVATSRKTGPASDVDADAAERAATIPQSALFRRAYVLVVLLGILALGIPVAGVLVSDLPAGLRPFAWLALLAITIGFAWLALAWLDPEKRRRS